MVKVSSGEIASAIGKCKIAAKNYPTFSETYGAMKNLDKPQKMTPALTWRLLLAALDGTTTFNTLYQFLNLTLLSCTVRCALSVIRKQKYKIKMHALLFTAMHKENQVLWARKHVVWSAANLKKFVFIDGNSFIQTGQTSYCFTGTTFVQMKEDFQPDKLGERGGWAEIMILGGFQIFGKAKLSVLKGFQNSFQYIQMLRYYCFPSAEANHGEEVILQQDITPIPLFTRLLEL